MRCHKDNAKKEVHTDKHLHKKKNPNNLTLHLNKLQKEKQTKPKFSRKNKISIRAEIKNRK